MQIRIAVLSDDPIFCEGLERLFGAERSFTVVGRLECAAPPEALRAAGPDVVFIDSRIDGALGFCSTLARGRGPAVIFVAAPEDDGWAVEAICAGARGVVLKSAPLDSVIKAVLVVHNGEVWASRRVVVAAWARQVAHMSEIPRSADVMFAERLTRREQEVFRHAAAGLGNKQVADRLAISEATVKVHLTHIFQKLGLNGRAQLAAAYHGILPPAA